MDISLLDKIIISLLIISFILGWFRGFLRSLIGPFAFAGSFFFAVLYYDVNNNLLVSCLIVLLGTVGVAIILSTLFTIALATVNKEYRGKVFLPSRILGSLINVFWQGNLICILLITTAALPLTGPRFESAQDQILNSQMIKFQFQHITSRIPELKSGIMTIQNFQDPEAMMEIKNLNEYKSFINDSRTQDLLADLDFQEAYQHQNYLRLLQAPALRNFLNNSSSVYLLTNLLQKVYRANYSRITASSIPSDSKS